MIEHRSGLVRLFCCSLDSRPIICCPLSRHCNEVSVCTPPSLHPTRNVPLVFYRSRNLSRSYQLHHTPALALDNHHTDTFCVSSTVNRARLLRLRDPATRRPCSGCDVIEVLLGSGHPDTDRRVQTSLPPDGLSYSTLGFRCPPVNLDLTHFMSHRLLISPPHVFGRCPMLSKAAP